MSPLLKTNYLVRENLFDLSKQYYLYGLYKPIVFRKVVYGFRSYHFVPAIHLILSILSLVIVGFNGFGFTLFFLLLIFCFYIFNQKE